MSARRPDGVYPCSGNGGGNSLNKIRLF